MFTYCCASFDLVEISEDRSEHGIQLLVDKSIFNGWMYVSLKMPSLLLSRWPMRYRVCLSRAGMCNRKNICSVGCIHLWQFCFRLIVHSYFQAFKAALVSSLAERTNLKKFATKNCAFLVALNIQISRGCILLAFVLDFTCTPYLFCNMKDFSVGGVID